MRVVFRIPSALLARRIGVAIAISMGLSLLHALALHSIAFASVVTLAACLSTAFALRRDAQLLRLSARLEALADTSSASDLETRLADNAAGVERAVASLHARLDERHRVTGLPTREPLVARMAADGAGCLGAIAISDFERINAFDTGLGEYVLRTTAERMTRMLPPGRFLAQVDRAHLAIWFGGVPATVARAELEAIGYALTDRIRSGERDILPEIIVRHAEFAADRSTPEATLTRTLAALAIPYAADRAALPQAVDPVTVARERYDLEQDLRQAIDRGQFELVFQPLVDAANRCVAGAEALIRWHHPERGVISPARFIPIAESAGLSKEIGRWTLNTAAREARRWQTLGLVDLRVAVNVSAHQLEGGELPQILKQKLARHNLGPDALEIELTEGTAAADPGQAAELFESIRALGVTIAIDDFGTGFSSLSSLRQLKFDKLKIDREFVAQVDTRQDSQAICQSIIALGRGLGLRVLAEGVERREEYEWLMAHGCHHFQGYFFAKPLDADDFVAFVYDQAALVAQLDIPANRLLRIERLIA